MTGGPPAETVPASFELTELHDADDLEKLQAVLAGIWGRAEEPPVPAELMRALVHAGNYVVGARDGGRLVGGLIGFAGWDRAGAPILHSHILGVLPDARRRGVGFALKQHQRHWAMERGIGVIEWTFDPLVRRNAYFNLAKLGAEAAEYHVAFYGRMEDRINAGDDSDRIVVRWHLDSAGAAGGDGSGPDPAPTGAVLLRVGPEGEPVLGTALPAGGTARCQVPADIVQLRRASPGLARAWRQALRSTLGEAMRDGWRVTAATRDGWYVLEGPGRRRR
jgi:predicted GNAT superfamily acetyltransferase